MQDKLICGAVKKCGPFNGINGKEIDGNFIPYILKGAKKGMFKQP